MLVASDLCPVVRLCAQLALPLRKLVSALGDSDHFTIPSLLNPLKLHAGSFEVTHVLTLADSLGMDVLQDGGLLKPEHEGLVGYPG